MPGGYVDISRITQLTHDRSASIRLYKSYKQKHPDKSPEWVVEKIVEDILRDRGVYYQKPRGTYQKPQGKSSTKVNFKKTHPRFPKVTKKSSEQWIGGAAVAALAILGQMANSANDHRLIDFPPPNPYEQISAGSQVTMSNRVPEPMTIRLKGANQQSYEFRIERCSTCGTSVSDEEGDRLCDGPGPSLTFAVPPGTYDARITFAGNTRGFKSRWSIMNGWNHGQCIFRTQDLY